MRIARALALCLLPSLASAQPLQPVQLLDTFTKSPSHPNGGLLQVPDGSFYGVTDDAIYRVTPGGQVTTAARLTDGRAARGALARGPDGALYGTTQRGGTGGGGTVFRFDPATSAVRTLHAFDGADEGAAPEGGLALAGGYLYGVTGDGLNFPSRATIFRTDPATGATDTRYIFPPLPDPPHWIHREFVPTSPLTAGGDGLLYGTTRSHNGSGTLYRFDPSSAAVTFVHQFPAGPSLDTSAWPSGRLHLAPDGRLYGTTVNGVVFRFGPATGTFEAIHVIDDPGGIYGRPGPIVVAPDGSLFGTISTSPVGVSESVIFRLRPAPGGYTFEVAHQFGPPVQLFPVAVDVEFAIGADGLIYGYAQQGGPVDAGSVYRFDPASDPLQLSVLHAFPESTAWGPSPPTPFADGALYGTSRRGGASGRGGFYRLDPASGDVAELGDMPGPLGQGQALHLSYAFTSLLADGGDGFLYAVSYVPPAAGTVRILRLNPATGTVTVPFQAPPSDRGNIFQNSRQKMARTPAGHLYFLSHSRVMRFDPVTGTVAIGEVVPGGGQRDATSLVVAADGRIYFGLSALESVSGPETFRRTLRLMRVDTATLAAAEVVNLGTSASVTSIMDAPDGGVYLATHFDVRGVDPAGTHRVVCTAPSPGFFSSVSAAPDGRLVAVITDGLTRVQTLGICTPSTGVLERRGLPPGIGRLQEPLVSAGGWLYGATWDEPSEISADPAPNLPQPGGALVRLSLDTPPPAIDSDGDGLPNTWETTFGLDPFSSGGPAGDADGDGRTDAQELADGTHPNGLVARYFAEGATGAFFHTRLDIANPNGGKSATVLLRFLTDSGERISHAIVIDPSSRFSLDPATLPGLAHGAFSTVVESDAEIAVGRTMTWGAGDYGSHVETGIAAPATTWYFAEGSTSGPFSLFYLLQNPHATAVEATIRYLRPSGLTPIEKSYTLAPFSRTTIAVGGEGVELASTDLSAIVTAPSPIVAERAMYYSQPGQLLAAGHESAGVTAPALEWFLAEGATGAFFDLFLLIANPSPTPANVEVEYLLVGGGTLTKNYVVTGHSRSTIWVDDEQLPAGSGTKPLAAAALSMVVRSTNGVPIVVERTMWWPGPSLTANYWYEAHNSPGSTTAAARWVVPGGEIDSATGARTYVLIANPSATPTSVRLTTLDGRASRLLGTMTLPAKSRTSVDLGEFLSSSLVSVLVESVAFPAVPIVVEYASYASPGGVIWARGGNALAAPLP